MACIALRITVTVPTVKFLLIQSGKWLTIRAGIVYSTITGVQTMKNVIYAGSVVLATVLVLWAAGLISPVPSANVVAQEAEEAVQPAGFQYAQLQVSNNNYRFEISGTRAFPRDFDLTGMYRFLGGRQRASFVNILGLIGEDGWTLIDVSPDRKVYTFAR